MFLVLCVVYNQGGYIEIVQGLTEKCMEAAVEEVKGLPSYSSGGEVSVLFMLSHAEL